MKIPVGVEDGKISVKKETKIASKGDVVTREMSSLMQKLNINPMEIGLNLLAASEAGTIYPSEILFVPAGHYIDRLKTAYMNAFALTIGIGYVTKDNIEMLISKASREANSLVMKAGFVTDETLKPLLARGNKEAEMLKEKTKETMLKENGEIKEGES